MEQGQVKITDYLDPSSTTSPVPETVNRASNVAITAPVDQQTGKRPLSSTGSSSSPDPKKLYFIEGQELDIAFEGDTPHWVPLIFRSFDTLNRNVISLTSKLDAFEAHKAESDVRIASLEKQVQYNQMVIQHLLKQVDVQESYSSRECLLLHGVPENDKEDTDLVFVAEMNTHLNAKISPDDLDRSHRLGKKVPGAKHPRPIMAKIVRHNVKASIYANKRKLKGKKLMLTERLTKRRNEMFRYAREQYGKFNVWTNNGEIIAKRNDKIENITEYLYSIGSTISNYSSTGTTQTVS